MPATSAARPERRPAAWAAPLLLLAAPKCLLCLATWAGVGAWFAGPELCGGPAGWSASAWLGPLAVGALLGAGHCFVRRARSR